MFKETILMNTLLQVFTKINTGRVIATIFLIDLDIGHPPTHTHPDFTKHLETLICMVP